MKKKILIILLLTSLITKAQEVYPLDKVTHLELGRASIFPSVKNNNLFTKKYILKVNPLEIVQSTHPETKENLEETNVKIISIDDVEKLSKEEIIEKLKQKEWLINKISKNNEEYLQTIQMLTPNLWIHRLYGFNTNDYLTGNRQKSWNIIAAQIYPMIFVSLPNNAIYLQGDKNNRSYIVPVDNKFKVGFNSGTGAENQTEILEELNKENLNIDIEKSTYQSLNEFFKIEELTNHKFQLTDYWGGSTNIKPLDETYDEIVQNKYFIVTKEKNSYDIYNTFLQPIIKDVNSYFFDGYYVQILKNGQITTLGAQGNIRNIYNQNFVGCGTMPVYDYQIIKDKNRIYNLISRSGYHNEPATSKGIAFQVKSPIKIDEIKWLDGSDRIGYSSLQYNENDVNLSRELLIIQNNKKFGIALPEYDKNTAHIKLLTEIIFDRVSFTSYDEPLLLHKDQQIFILGLSLENPAILGPYQEIGERKKYFIRYTKENGKKGWCNLLRSENIDDDQN